MSLPVFLFLLLMSLSSLSAQTSDRRLTISGTVSDSATGELLRAATVRVEGTPTGTMTSREGAYLLRLPPGSYTLVFSMIGYGKQRHTVVLREEPIQLPIALASADFSTPELVVTAESPGMLLMRKAIARKLRQRDSLQAYTYTLYSKFVAATDTLTAGRASNTTDTTIVAVFESYSHGWFREPDSYFNEIIQRRQSANIPPQANFVTFGTNINAYEDEVLILGENIATPFHPDAPDFYDFEIEREYRRDDSTTIVRISAKPTGNGRKQFSGTIDLDKKRLVPIAMHLHPSKSVQLPFDAAMNFTQFFEEFDEKFLMPTGLRIEGSMQAELLWVINPRIDILIETMAYDYTFNQPADGDLFERRRVEAAPTADVVDSAFWYDNAVLPLKPEEDSAYREIQAVRDNPDSVERRTVFDKVLRPVTIVVSALARRPFTGWQDILRYNRIHGAYLGLGLVSDPTEWMTTTVKGGYGFADKRAYGEADLSLFADSLHKYALRFSGYKKLMRRDNPYTVTQPTITLMSLFLKNDYGDYYYNTGGEVALETGFGQLRFLRANTFVRPTRLGLIFRTERHATASNRTDFSVFGGSGPFRSNPPIFDGALRSLSLDFAWNYHPERRFDNFGFRLYGEMSEPSVLPSDFRFRQLQSVVMFRMPTMPLWMLEVRLFSGWSFGDVPPQRFFSLESSASAVAAAGALRGMTVKEFYGDRYASLSVEHNFGELIPGILRIPNLAAFGIEFIANVGIGWSEFSERTRAYTSTLLPSTQQTREGVYYEAGLGLNKILFIFRIDTSARFSQVSSPRFFFTLGFAQF